MRPKHTNGFTLVEMIVVVGIIGVLSLVAVVSLSNARLKSRDTKRVAHIKQINDALELYYLHNGIYPTLITAGQNLVVGSTIYLNPVPSNPIPRNDNVCPNQDYSYFATTDNNDYSLNFCLGAATTILHKGVNSASGGGGLNSAAGLVAWWKFEEGSGSTAYSTTGQNNGTWSGAGTHYITGKASSYAGQMAGGATNILTVPTATNIEFGTVNFTIALWFKMSITQQRFIFVKDNRQWGSTERGYSLIAVPNSQALGIYFVIGDGSKYQHAVFGTWQGAGLNDNNWHHMVVVVDRSLTKPAIYVDGVAKIVAIESGNNLNTIGDISSSSSVSIPDISGSAIGTYAYDDIRLYNRALTSAEAIGLYNVSN